MNNAGISRRDKFSSRDRHTRRDIYAVRPRSRGRYSNRDSSIQNNSSRNYRPQRFHGRSYDARPEPSLRRDSRKRGRQVSSPKRRKRQDTIRTEAERRMDEIESLPDDERRKLEDKLAQASREREKIRRRNLNEYLLRIGHGQLPAAPDKLTATKVEVTATMSQAVLPLDTLENALTLYAWPGEKPLGKVLPTKTCWNGFAWMVKPYDIEQLEITITSRARKLYIGSLQLEPHVVEADVGRAFGDALKKLAIDRAVNVKNLSVLRVWINKEAQSNFGFVEFTSADAAELVISSFDALAWENNTLIIRRPKEYAEAVETLKERFEQLKSESQQLFPGRLPTDPPSSQPGPYDKVYDFTIRNQGNVDDEPSIDMGAMDLLQASRQAAKKLNI